MSAIGGIKLNNGGTLPFGDLCSWYNPNVSGYNPVSTRVPGTIRPKAYKSQLEQMDRDAVDSITSYLHGRTWNNYEDFMTYLGQVQDDMENECIWLWGSFTNGGTFLYPTTSDTACGLCSIDYFKNEIDEETTQYGAFISSISLSYESEMPGTGGQIGDNYLAFFNIWDRHDDVGDLVPPRADYYGFYYIFSSAPTMYEGVDQLLPSSDPLNPHVLEWQQAESVYYRDWNYFKSNYLRNYTSIIDMQGNDDHPWLRYVQERVNVNGVIYLGMSESQYGERLTPSPMGGETYEPGENPYGGDESTEDGGKGDGSDYSDEIDDGGLPESSLISSGMCSIYLPTKANIQAFANFLFSDISDSLVTHIKKMFVDPLQSILNLSLCHLNIPYSSASEIGFAGVGSGVTAPVANQTYYELNYSLNLREYWGSALDYSSYTKIKIYLPYCGIYDLSVDDFMAVDGNIEIIYKVDITSGMCVAMVKCNRRDKNGNSLKSVLYQFNGNIFLNVPISSTNWNSMFQSVLNMASVAVSPSPSALVGMASDVMSQKVSVQKSGQIGSNFGYMGIQTPYLIIERPAQSLPANFGSFNGYPSNLYGSLSSFKGYIEVDTDKLWVDDVHCTDAEAEEIKSLFNSGVYL